MATTTPWGQSQDSRRIARGIMEYSTASHGGLHLSSMRNAQVHSAFRDLKGWYEEDIAYNVVVLTFPEFFTTDQIDNAKSVLRDYYPDAWTSMTGEKLTGEQSRVLRQRAARAQYAHSYITVAAYGPWHKNVPEGKIGVYAVRGGRLESGHYASDDRKYFLVSAEEYAATRTSLGFVVDESRHQAVRWTE